MQTTRVTRLSFDLKFSITYDQDLNILRADLDGVDLGHNPVFRNEILHILGREFMHRQIEHAAWQDVSSEQLRNWIDYQAYVDRCRDMRHIEMDFDQWVETVRRAHYPDMVQHMP